MASLNEILNEVAPRPQPATVETPAVVETAPAVETKDAPKTEPAKVEAPTGEKESAPPADAQEQGQVPLSALKAKDKERKDWKEKALRLEGELKAFKEVEAAKSAQPPAKPPEAAAEAFPDPLLDPEGYAKAVEDRAERRAANSALNISETIARQTHGDETVDAAFEWLKSEVLPKHGDIALKQLMAERHPYDVLVKAHAKARKMAEIGDDPDAYRARIEAELREKILAETAGERIAPTSQSPANRVPPPSLANVRNAGPRNGPAFTGPTPLKEILR